MLTVRDWLHPSNGAIINGAEYDCVGRVDFDRRGGGMVLLRRPGPPSADPLIGALSVDLDDLAELEENGLVLPAETVGPAEVPSMPHVPTYNWLEALCAEGRLVHI